MRRKKEKKRHDDVPHSCLSTPQFFDLLTLLYCVLTSFYFRCFETALMLKIVLTQFDSQVR